MTRRTIPEKVKLTHPRTGSGWKIDADIYMHFKTAILRSLKGSKGKTYTTLSEESGIYIRKKMPGFKGSIPWYTISVRLDLEARGIVETFSEKGKKLNRLKMPVVSRSLSK